MSIVSVTSVPGARGATTIAAALGLTWPDEVMVVELDPSGGDLGAWFDLGADPGLATAVTAPPVAGIPAAHTHSRPVAVGLRVLPAPVRAKEAAVVVNEAATRLVPVLSAYRDVHVVVDAGRSSGSLGPVASQSALVVVAVSQVQGSSRATAAVIDRAGELVDVCGALAMPVHVAVIGDDPFPLREIESYVGCACHGVAFDPLGAAVIAGRAATGRLSTRSRLLRSVRPMAESLFRELTSMVGAR